MSAITLSPVAGAAPPRAGFRLPGPLWAWGMLSVVVGFSSARLITGNNDLTSGSLFEVALRSAAPIAMAGLAGLYSERSGTVNIGLEGMMVLGTVFAGWWGFEHGPWMALLGGVFGGILGGLLLGLATVTFKVNHIVAGFAINILAPGVARFMSTLFFVDQQGGSYTNSPSIAGKMGSFTMPFLSGGPFFWLDSTTNPLRDLEKRGWFMVSDVAGLLRGLTTGVRYDIVLGIVLFVLSTYVLWHTRFGLRLRSAGERPSAADSLGVRVLMYRYIGVAISGGLAGFGGAMLALAAGRYSQGAPAGRGFLGLATLVVGNWKPLGIGSTAMLFGYFDGITLRLKPGNLVIALMLAAAIVLAIALAYKLAHDGFAPESIIGAALGAAGIAVFLLAFQTQLGENVGLFLLMMVGGLAIATVAIIRARAAHTMGVTVLAMSLALSYLIYRGGSVPAEAVGALPYFVTLVVVAAGGRTLRPPAAAGEPWSKGQQG